MSCARKWVDNKELWVKTNSTPPRAPSKRPCWRSARIAHTWGGAVSVFPPTTNCHPAAKNVLIPAKVAPTGSNASIPTSGTKTIRKSRRAGPLPPAQIAKSLSSSATLFVLTCGADIRPIMKFNRPFVPGHPRRIRSTGGDAAIAFPVTGNPHISFIGYRLFIPDYPGIVSIHPFNLELRFIPSRPHGVPRNPQIVPIHPHSIPDCPRIWTVPTNNENVENPDSPVGMIGDGIARPYLPIPARLCQVCIFGTVGRRGHTLAYAGRRQQTGATEKKVPAGACPPCEWTENPIKSGLSFTFTSRRSLAGTDWGSLNSATLSPGEILAKHKKYEQT